MAWQWDRKTERRSRARFKQSKQASNGSNDFRASLYWRWFSPQPPFSTWGTGARDERGGGALPRTCLSRLRMTCTACCRMISLVCALSLFRCSWHMRPSSRKASLMSRTRTLSRALLARRRSRSRCSFSSTVKHSSDTLLPRATGVLLITLLSNQLPNELIRA